LISHLFFVADDWRWAVRTQPISCALKKMGHKIRAGGAGKAITHVRGEVIAI
jgi:hypothetical protein